LLIKSQKSQSCEKEVNQSLGNFMVGLNSLSDLALPANDI